MKKYIKDFFIILFVVILFIFIDRMKSQQTKLFELENRVGQLEGLVTMWFYGPVTVLEDSQKRVDFGSYDIESLN